MAAIVPGRHTVVRDEPFVVFIIGMRINKLWAIHKWLPVFMAMPRMLKELGARPELGFLAGHFWLSRAPVVIQYWRNVEQLNAYAKARDHAHLPAWKHFNQAVAASGAVGVFHETYVVQRGAYECIYVNMPPFGLGSIDRLREATADLTDAEGRMGTHTPASRSNGHDRV